MPTALVTGGSSGIGYAFAQQLAARGDDLVLVARGESRLKSAAQALHTLYGTSVDIVPADLGRREDLSRVERLCMDRRIDTLVNDAGFAAHDDLLATDWSGQEKALDVMCLAVLVLSGAAARRMAERGGGEIINVSSINALVHADNYSAIKRWVLSYTEALDGRLRGTGVHATAVLPGWVKTEFHAAAGLRRPHVPGWLWVPPATVARTALADVRRGKVFSVPTLRWRIAAWVLLHGPAALPRLVARVVRGGHEPKTGV